MLKRFLVTLFIFFSSALFWGCSDVIDGSLPLTSEDDGEDNQNPSFFDFTDLANQSVRAPISSDIVEVTGFTGTLTMSLNGSFAPEPFRLSDFGSNLVGTGLRGATSAPSSMKMHPDGTKAYVFGAPNGTLYEFELKKPWDMSSLVYQGINKAFVEVTYAEDFIITNDGTQIFVINNTDNKVYQYSLGIPWDITTASSALGSYDFTAVDAQAYSMTFDDTGDILYFYGRGLGRVFELNLAVAYDLSTISYSGVNFGLSAIGDRVSSLEFINEGRKLVAVDWNWDAVNVYDLPQPYDLFGLNFEATKEIGRISLFPVSAMFRPDGLAFFVLDEIRDAAIQFDLETAFDLRTATQSYGTSWFYDVQSLGSFSTALRFTPDGSQMFHLDAGAGGDRIFHHNLSTPFDVTTAVHSGISFYVGDQDTLPFSFSFNDNGSKLYMGGGATSTIYQYSLGVPYNISTASWDGAGTNLDVSGTDSEFSHFEFSADGSRLFWSGDVTNQIHQYNLGSPFQINTAVDSGLDIDPPLLETEMRSFRFNDDGSEIFILGMDLDEIFHATLNSPYSLAGFASGNYTPQKLLVLEFSDKNFDFEFSTDGTKLFVTGDDQDRIYQLQLDNPFDLNSMTKEFPQINTSGYKSVHGFRFSPDGQTLYLMSTSFPGTIFQVGLSTPFDVTSGGFDQSQFLNGEPTTIGVPLDIAFNDDGSKLYAVGDSLDNICEYSLSTAYDITTTSSGVIPDVCIAALVTNPTTMVFDPSGANLFVGGNNGEIRHFILGTPFDLSTFIDQGTVLDYTSIDPAGSTHFMDFIDEGNKILISTSSNQILKFDLTAPYDVATAVYNGDYLGFETFQRITSNLTGFHLNSTGDLLSLADSNSGTITQVPQKSFSHSYRICGDSQCDEVKTQWTSQPNSLVSGDYLQLYLFTDYQNSYDNLVELQVGSTEVDWLVQSEP